MSQTVLSDEIKERLNKKLVDLVNYTEELKQQKKNWNSSLGEQIKEAEKKSKAIGQAMKQGDQTLLHDAFSPEELDVLVRGR